MQLANAVKNMAKMGVWIVLAPVAVHELGILKGILVYALAAFVWNIGLTLLQEYSTGGMAGVKEVLSTIFSTDLTLPFTVYGCYCSPKYGSDGRTKDLLPIDGLDTYCQQHDDSCLAAAYEFTIGNITKSEYVHRKNQADWTFMKGVIGSDNSATGVYLIGLEIGFLFRIISRTLPGA